MVFRMKCEVYVIKYDFYYRIHEYIKKMITFAKKIRN